MGHPDRRNKMERWTEGDFFIFAVSIIVAALACVFIGFYNPDHIHVEINARLDLDSLIVSTSSSSSSSSSSGSKVNPSITKEIAASISEDITAKANELYPAELEKSLGNFNKDKYISKIIIGLLGFLILLNGVTRGYKLIPYMIEHRINLASNKSLLDKKYTKRLDDIENELKPLSELKKELKL